MNRLEYHNPDNVIPEQVNEGWRLCLKSEVDSLPEDAEFLDRVRGRWEPRPYPGQSGHRYNTYRTRAPLPEATTQDIPEGCQPFDLEKAKAGHPLITRDGREAKFIAHVPDEPNGYGLVVQFPQGLRFCASNGRFWPTEGESDHDIYLRAPRKVKREAWIATSISALNKWAHASAEEAKAHADKENEMHGRVDLVVGHVTWEE